MPKPTRQERQAGQIAAEVSRQIGPLVKQAALQVLDAPDPGQPFDRHLRETRAFALLHVNPSAPLAALVQAIDDVLAYRANPDYASRADILRSHRP
jgi:hypothetical protein